MKKIIIAGLILATAFFASCKQKTERKSLKEIPIKYVNPDKKEKLSSIVSAIKYIKLETRPDFLVGDLRIIKMLDKLYCMSQKKINVFDLNGKALFEIDHYESQAPGGYMRLNDFMVDTIAKIIEIWDRGGRRINRYDNNNGKFLSSQRFNIYATKFIRDSEWNYYFYAGYMSNTSYTEKDELYELFKFNKEGKFLNKFLKEKYFNKSFMGGGLYILNAYKGNIYFNPFANDFVYTLKNDSLLKIFQFNFGRHSLKDYNFKENLQGSVAELNNTEFAYSFGGFQEYNFGWQFNYSFRKYEGRIFLCFLSKETGKIVVSNGFENDFLGYRTSPGYLTSPSFVQDDVFITISEARSLMKIYSEIKNNLPGNKWEQYKIDHSNFCTVCENLSELDNPVIILMTPKEF